MTGQEWEYERIPFTTSAGQTVQLYSVVLQDYNGDGEVNSDDIAWIGDNNTSRVQNLPTLRRHQAQRATTTGSSSSSGRGCPNRWQALASVLYSSSSGMGRRSFRQDINVEGPMFWDDNWMGSLNQTINNLEGPLPFTPKWEVKVSGSYTVPKIEVDLGARLRFHDRAAGVDAGGVSPAHPVRRSAGGRDRHGGGPDRRRGSQQPRLSPQPDPPRSPPREGLQAGRGQGSSSSSSTGSTSSTPTRPPTSTSQWEYGRVTTIPQGRRFRLGVRFQF